jgi:hypothetical protein
MSFEKNVLRSSLLHRLENERHKDAFLIFKINSNLIWRIGESVQPVLQIVAMEMQLFRAGVRCPDETSHLSIFPFFP